MMGFLAILLLSGSLQAVLGFQSGAPESSCNRMFPGHGRAPKRGSPPYKLTILNTQSDRYSPNQDIQVQLTGKDGENFRGFQLQVREVGGHNHPLGTFLLPVVRQDGRTVRNSYKKICSGAGLTQALFRRYSDVRAIWRAPAQTAGDIFFIATVVKQYADIWMNVTSSVLRDASTMQNLTTSEPLEKAANDSLVNVTSCPEESLEPLPNERPLVAILCTTHAHCPCGWSCCSLTANYALCRKPQELDAGVEVDTNGETVAETDDGMSEGTVEDLSD